MRKNTTNLEEEIKALKSLHLAWATLNKLKKDCEEEVWPFCDSRDYLDADYDEMQDLSLIF